LLEHLPSNVRYIKTSLVCIAKYIKNKKINSSAECDSLTADVHNNLFRQKVSYHCIPKTNLIKNGKSKGKSKGKETDKLASIERLSPSIPAKTPKKVNKISKFFKAKAPVHTTNRQGMSYTQASKGRSNTESVLKIKKAFPTLKANNIDSI